MERPSFEIVSRCASMEFALQIHAELVPGAGLEPAQYFYRGILSPLCLPIPPPGQ